jgi:ABC-type microcin C transport system duplicated ATPase subunit YejF
MDNSTIVIRGAREHNLRNVSLDLPRNQLIVFTGVSGSGKSSLVNEVLYLTLARRLHRARTPAVAHDDILGLEQIDKVINVDQDPIGNSPMSNPATYTGGQPGGVLPPHGGVERGVTSLGMLANAAGVGRPTISSTICRTTGPPSA